jgi:ketosteroid isomerase-like protein
MTTQVKSQTEAVFLKHLQALGQGVDAIMEDYSDDSMLLTPDATFRGVEQIRGFFTAVTPLFTPAFFQAMTVIRQEITDEVAYVVWKSEPVFGYASDTFLIRNGKILVQTFAGIPGGSAS